MTMTSQEAQDKLFQLLPAFYRAQDAAQGGILEDLLAVFQDVLDTLEADIDGLYENWFIETCADWVVPYIGELLKTQPLYTASDDSLSARAYVAHTLSYRRRKGTAVALQQLASDITGWPACAVEFFHLLGTTQYINHLRPTNVATPDLRQSAALDRIGSPFDPFARTIDVRGIGAPPLGRSLAQGTAVTPASIRGRYNIPNAGLFLWRLQSYPLTAIAPCPVTTGADGRFRFNVLGLDQPLFNQPQTLPAFTQLATEINVPGRLRRRALFDELEARRQFIVDQNMAWLPGTAFPLGAAIVDANGNTQHATAAGTSGPTPPLWPTDRLAVVTDGTVLWQLVATGAALGGAFFAGEPVFTLARTPGGTPIPPEQIVICDLGDLPAPAPPGTWRTPPTSATYQRAGDGKTVTLPLAASVDPVRGRLVFAGTGLPVADQVRVSASFGFSGDLGGGPYNRADSVTPLLADITPWQVAVSRTLPPQPGLLFPTLTAAVAAWNALPAVAERFGVIAILDSDTYTETPAQIAVPSGSTLLIVAADWPSLRANATPLAPTLRPVGVRPTLRGNLSVAGVPQPGGGAPGTLMINGLLLDGSLTVAPGDLGGLQLIHTTLVPAAGGLIVQAAADALNNSLAVALTRTICGPIQLAASVPTLTLTDTIVDAGLSGVALTAPGTDATLAACTLFGSVGTPTASGVRTLQASDTLFTATVVAERVQSGCVRFCYLPAAGSHVPRRYRCQPDLALADQTSPGSQANARARLTPSFTSVLYGDPGYAQLSDACAGELRAGAEDGSEIGAFSFLKQPQRDTNLRTAVLDHLRFGMQSGIVYVT